MNFGNSAAKPFSFGNTGTAASQTQLNMFGSSQNKPSLFGSSAQQQPPSINLFGTSNQSQQGISLFNPSSQQQSNAFGQSAQQQQQQQQPQPRPFAESLQYGQSLGPNQAHQQHQSFHSSTLSPYRSIPQQLQQVASRWNPNDLSSPFRAYLYHNVEKEEESVKYQPEPQDDVSEWEKAVSRRPGPTYVPQLHRGFEGLAQRAKTQQQYLMECHAKLVAINNSLEVQADRHRQFVATRLAESRRRHERISRRTLSLAIKVQILRNKGYVMDNAEEELKEKLDLLEREVMDPSLQAREQEVWARMIEIRERSKRIKADMERFAATGTTVGKDGDQSTDGQVLSEEMVEKARKVCLLSIMKRGLRLPPRRISWLYEF